MRATPFLGTAMLAFIGALAAACSSPFVATGSDAGGLDANRVEAETPDSGIHDATADQGDAILPPVDSGGDAGDADVNDAKGSDATGDVGTQDAPGGCALGETCEAVPPQGWAGPIAFAIGGGAPPACPPGTSKAFVGSADLVAPPAGCSSCSCTGSVSCGPTTLDFWTNSSCTGGTCASATATAACSAVPSSCATGASVYVSVQSSPSAAGCVPSNETPSVPPATWSTSAIGCTALAASCGNGQACAPTPGAPFGTCIYQAGDLSCPSGPYGNKQVVYGGIADARSCSPCTCGAAGGATCSGGTVIYSATSAACASAGSLAVPTDCHDLGLLASSQFGVELGTQSTLSDATCAPGGGQATGSAAGTDPTTVCCR